MSFSRSYTVGKIIHEFNFMKPEHFYTHAHTKKTSIELRHQRDKYVLERLVRSQRPKYLPQLCSKEYGLKLAGSIPDCQQQSGSGHKNRRTVSCQMLKTWNMSDIQFFITSKDSGTVFNKFC